VSGCGAAKPARQKQTSLTSNTTVQALAASVAQIWPQQNPGYQINSTSCGYDGSPHQYWCDLYGPDFAPAGEKALVIVAGLTDAHFCWSALDVLTQESTYGCVGDNEATQANTYGSAGSAPSQATSTTGTPLRYVAGTASPPAGYRTCSAIVEDGVKNSVFARGTSCAVAVFVVARLFEGRGVFHQGDNGEANSYTAVGDWECAPFQEGSGECSGPRGKGSVDVTYPLTTTTTPATNAP
jgi:hypothetical protein